jgi:hypothetical protein
VSVEFAYAAHTDSCTLLLDENGVCRHIMASNGRDPRAPAKREPSPQATSQCLGAQYVASLDPSTDGGLAQMPRAGLSMLFARIEDDGRITLVRAGPIGLFEMLNEVRPRANGIQMRSHRAPAHGSMRDDATHNTPTRRVRRPDAFEEASASEEREVGASNAEVHEPKLELEFELEPELELEVEGDWNGDTETTRYDSALDAFQAMRTPAAETVARTNHSAPVSLASLASRPPLQAHPLPPPPASSHRGTRPPTFSSPSPAPPLAPFAPPMRRAR